MDGAVFKTVNVPEDFDLAALRDLFERADAAGLKGFTVFRPSPERRGVLSVGPPDVSGESGCCELPREEARP